MSGLKIQLVLLCLTFCLLLYFTHCLSFESESAFTIVSHDSDHGFITTEERVVETFEKWRERHGEVYKHEEEKEMRLKSFKKNLNYILERNRKNKKSDIGQHEVGINVFANMSNEEFRQTYLPSSKLLISKRIKENNPHGHMTDYEAPTSMDWRKKVSCWAFSSTGAMEGIDAIVTGELVEFLSLQNANKSKLPSQSINHHLFLAVYVFVREEKKIITIDGYKDVAPEENVLFCSVANQPISVGIAGFSLDFLLYTGGVYDGDCSSNPKDVDHRVLIVCYGSKDDQDYWIVKNSCGTKWDLEYDVCAINVQASYPTKTSVSPFPSPINPPPPYLRVHALTKCGDHIAYCQSGETCCCILKFYGVCLVYGCCGYENGVCCSESTFCCPQDFPVCDTEYGVLAAKRRKMMKDKFP
ncbi:hypothetical protein MKX01_018091 [Papaver californicum]|nr:hypothetical protein MKX01_018091 [Papaver californicum]